MRLRVALRGLAAVVGEDLRAHEGDWTRPGFQALAVHRFGRFALALPFGPSRVAARGLHRALFRFCRNIYGIELPAEAAIGRRVVFEHQHGVVVHGRSIIGDDCVLRQGCTLGMRRMSSPLDAPVLGNRVELGAGAVVLGAVHVGDGAMVGANAVVLRDVPAGALAVGAPARIMAARAGARASFPTDNGD